MDATQRPPSRRRRAGGIAGLRRYSVLFAGALVAFGVAEVLVFAVQRRASNWADHSRLVATLARTAELAALQREDAVQGHLRSGTDDARIAAHAAGGQLSADLDSLVALTADNPQQQARVRAIAAAVGAWNSDFASPALAGALAGRASPTLGDKLFAPVQTAFAEFLTAEDVLYDDRRNNSRLAAWLAVIAMLIPSGLMAGIVVASGRRFADQAEQLVVQQTQLEEQAVELEQQVQELEVANTELGEAVTAERRARDLAALEAHERQRNSALLDAALKSSPVALALLDPDLRYLHVNEGTASLTGLAVDDHLGKTLREVNSVLDPAFEQALLQVVRTGAPLQNMEVLRPEPGKNGRTRFLLVNAYPILGVGGETLGLGVTAIDTTDHRELQEQFHHAQKLEAVGRLAAGIAHDFNNLLTVIRSYCDLVLLEMPEGAAGRQEVKEIRSAGERAAALSRQMLTMSRKQTIIPRPLAVAEVVTEFEPMLRRVTGDAVELRVRLDQRLGIVHIDATQLEQVLMNLVTNAVDAMPGGGRIVIEGSNAALDEQDVKRYVGLRPGTYTLLSVRDNGTGIDDATLRQIFDPFFTTKPQGKGTGLGLSTVYGIVKQAGGHVRVDSRVGEGTTFTVCLPCELPDDGLAIRKPPPDVDDRTLMGTETVLVVEDEDVLRGSVARVLRRHGYTVLEASHGGEAMRVSAGYDGPIHLVVSDFHMPGMDGRDLVARLVPSRGDMHVLFMSGSSRGNEAVTGTDGDAFLSKPFSFDQLLLLVRQLLSA